MNKECLILAVTILALCQAIPVENTKPEVVPVATLVNDANDDLTPEASAWGYGGGGWGRRYYGSGYGYGGGWGRGRGGWGGGYRKYGGWGRGYGGGGYYWG